MFVTAATVSPTRIPLVRSKLCRLLELLEPERQSVPVWAILTPPRQLDLLPNEFEKRTIMGLERVAANQDPPYHLIGVDPDFRIHVSDRCSKSNRLPNSLSASVTMWAASTSRGSGRWEIAHRPHRVRVISGFSKENR
jgi:hypothetical protein